MLPTMPGSARLVRTRVLLAVVAPAATTLMSSCGGPPTLPQAQVEKAIDKKLTEQVGQSPDDITCPGDLEGTVDTTMRCTLTAGGEKLGITVKVTSVEGTQINYDFKVDSLDQ